MLNTDKKQYEVSFFLKVVNVRRHKKPCMNCTLGIDGLSHDMFEILEIKVHGYTTKLEMMESNCVHLLKYVLKYSFWSLSWSRVFT